MTKWECYIEEYENDKGLSARLRDKKTNKKVSIKTASLDDKMHFLRFLSTAKANKDIMPTVFNRDGEDIVAVYGVKRSEDKNTIFIDTDKNGGGYLFE
ncbi:MAG: hypothetical protein NC340_00110 [Ruminococcus flavefaciens]|nr:hypothetical protein [Ruminococcus flavefaciens]MCM1228514.1 hypothetical protein [Ruminococcus flavefaciens]